MTNYVSTTKYSVLSFLPVNLFEQFKKKANLYFLIIAILSFTPVSPKTPLVSVIPLVFVLTVSAVKEAFEDFNRYKMDREMNNRKVQAYRDKKWAVISWKDVQVGDLLRVTEDAHAVPADCVILQSSSAQGICNIETSNLDGETNLKIKQAVGPTWQIECVDDGSDFPEHLSFILESEAPNPRMDKSSWNARLTLEPDGKAENVALGMNQMLQRGCTLRNTAWVICLVVFTGRETKLMLNSKSTVFKRSNIDLLVDKALITIFLFQACLCLFGTTSNYLWAKGNALKHWYFLAEPEEIVLNQNILFNYLTFLVLVDLLVPISLYVSMELVKFTQAAMIDFDLHMYDETSDTFAKARTSNLNEELGQIRFIFSDKTGTLTRNMMEFYRASIYGIPYGPGESKTASMDKKFKPRDPMRLGRNVPNYDKTFRFDDNRILYHMDEGDAHSNKCIDQFLTLLAVCNTVIPEFPTCQQYHRHGFLPEDIDDFEGPACEASVEYQAASPDEKALVLAAKNHQYYFHERSASNIILGPNVIDGQRCELNIRGTQWSFEVIEFLEFNSTRKRMSVIVRDPRDNKIKLYCKGADNVIYDRLSTASKEEMWATTEQQLYRFASDGLRTLCCAYRELTDDEFLEWYAGHLTAKNAIENRDNLVDGSSELVERELTLLGATAIEDRLQDGVPQAIANLSQSNIAIWVLTGDKVETAINIGRSCRLLSPQMQAPKGLIVIDINEALDEDTAKKLTEDALHSAEMITADHEEGDINQGFVISGRSLNFIFPPRKLDAKGLEVMPNASQLAEEKRLQDIMLKICRKCRAVICCRVSPKQKAQVVSLVRDNIEDTITLAIGDGANDVPMIKAAHVGIGISGQEGLQAVMASDYSIAQFRFLEHLLLVHGAWSYKRISKLILYSFYKNCAISLTQILYSFFSGFSGQLFYDPWSGSLYNLVFTALPVLLVAVFDREMSAESAKKYPQLYKNGQLNGSFNMRRFFFYMLEGFMHACFVFFFAIGTFPVPTRPDGQNNDIWTTATGMFAFLVMTVTFKMMFETFTWVVWTFIIFALSIAAWFIWIIGYNALVIPGYGPVYPDMYFVSIRLYGEGAFWLGLFAVLVAAMLPEIIIRTYKMNYLSDDLDWVKHFEKNNLDPEEEAKKVQIKSVIIEKDEQKGAGSREQVQKGGDIQLHLQEGDKTVTSQEDLDERQALLLEDIGTQDEEKDPDKPKQKSAKLYGSIQAISSALFSPTRVPRMDDVTEESQIELRHSVSRLGYAPFAPDGLDERTVMSQFVYMRKLLRKPFRKRSTASLPVDLEDPEEKQDGGRGTGL